MENLRLPKKILIWKPVGARKREKLGERWVEEDANTMEIRARRRKAHHRVEWRRIVEKAKTYNEV